QSSCDQQVSGESDLAIVSRRVPKHPRESKKVVELGPHHLRENISWAAAEIVDDAVLGPRCPTSPPRLIHRTGQCFEGIAVVEELLGDKVEGDFQEVGLQRLDAVPMRVERSRDQLGIQTPVVLLVDAQHATGQIQRRELVLRTLICELDNFLDALDEAN